MSIRPALGALLVCLFFVSACASVQAEERREQPRAVLELFTSQGCSSCPPADALMAELALREDIIALAYHVDYWDYIGWSDTFATPAYSAHQRAYAESWGGTPIFTPQIVVNGAIGVVGSRDDEVGKAIDDAGLVLPVRLIVHEGTLSIDAEGQPGFAPGVVWLVTYIEGASVLIERGENSGKRMRYTQVVKDRQMVGLWEPEEGAHLKFPLSQLPVGPGEGVVVIIQQQHDDLPGKIIGAALYAP